MVKNNRITVLRCDRWCRISVSVVNDSIEWLVNPLPENHSKVASKTTASNIPTPLLFLTIHYAIVHKHYDTHPFGYNNVVKYKYISHKYWTSPKQNYDAKSNCLTWFLEEANISKFRTKK